METLLKLEEALEKRYSIFNKEDAFIEVTKDYLSINCYSYMFEYVERYFDWLVNFCIKFLKCYNYKGFVYIFGNLHIYPEISQTLFVLLCRIPVPVLAV